MTAVAAKSASRAPGLYVIEVDGAARQQPHCWGGRLCPLRRPLRARGAQGACFGEIEPVRRSRFKKPANSRILFLIGQPQKQRSPELNANPPKQEPAHPQGPSPRQNHEVRFLSAGVRQIPTVALLVGNHPCPGSLKSVVVVHVTDSPHPHVRAKETLGRLRGGGIMSECAHARIPAHTRTTPATTLPLTSPPAPAPAPLERCPPPARPLHPHDSPPHRC